MTDKNWTHDYARQIARELGAPWRYDVRASRDADGELAECAALRTDLGAFGIQVRLDWRRDDRMLLIGHIPRQDRAGHHQYIGPDSAPRVTVAIARGPRAAARAITGRLLPVYQPAYASARKVLDRCNDELDELARVTRMLDPYGHPSGVRSYSGASDGRIILDRLPWGGTARVKHYGGTHVELSIEVTPEIAVKILQIVQNETPDGPRWD